MHAPPPPPESPLPPLLRALRPHQWVKNLLVFLPMVLGHRFDLPTLLAVAWSFVTFSACASAVYLVNDIVDLPADRDHPTKRSRPIAGGAVAVPTARAVAAGLVIVALGISWATLPPLHLVILLAYLAANLAYTGWLKRRPIVDVLVLAGMYALRVEAGGVAAEVPLSEWLLGFLLFFFTSLAFAKRCAELRGSAAAPGRITGRGYQADDLSLLETLGATSGYVSVVVLALYMNSEQMRQIYGGNRLLWLLCPLVLFWISRVWLIVRRGALDEDPVVFALRDRVSLLVAAACFAVVVAAALLRGAAV